MGLFICNRCNENLGITSSIEHTCDPERIEDFVARLKDDAQAAERRVREIQNAVMMLLKDLPPLEDRPVRVDANWLRRLWDATECRWYETGASVGQTADRFLTCWMAMHRVLCDAFRLFRKAAHGPKVLGRLTELKKACKNAQTVMYYHDSQLDLTPDDLATEAWEKLKS